ncbi:zinc-dependent alcohol dehydrogenase family protein [Streptomyces sp. T-3]|nr:zinc-dependent alcohol dehydrogenase family protein [Streptomyces sp. T-3]
MRAVVFEEFGQEAQVRTVPDPTPSPAGVVVRVGATGLCRSDWHGWMGHDPGIVLPHVPGHELAGVVEAVGPEVADWRVGDRVTVPFVCACGRCEACAAGQQQVCSRQTQPGFTHWGSFAEYVALEQADINLVALPEELSYATAAGLGCRFATAFRAVVGQGRVAPGEWVAVHGCGGVGLSAVQIAVACGARVIAVDVSERALSLARRFGAVECVDTSASSGAADVGAAVRELSGGGVQLSLDALGIAATCAASVHSLRWQGRHVQVGWFPAGEADPGVPMSRVMGLELRLIGSHGMAARDYPSMLGMVRAGLLRPDLLVSASIGLDEAPGALAGMGRGPAGAGGVTVIVP